MRTIFDGILRIQGIATTETNISLQEVFQREVNIDFIPRGPGGPPPPPEE